MPDEHVDQAPVVEGVVDDEVPDGGQYGCGGTSRGGAVKTERHQIALGGGAGVRTDGGGDERAERPGLRGGGRELPHGCHHDLGPRIPAAGEPALPGQPGREGPADLG